MMDNQSSAGSSDGGKAIWQALHSARHASLSSRGTHGLSPRADTAPGRDNSANIAAPAAYRCVFRSMVSFMESSRRFRTGRKYRRPEKRGPASGAHLKAG